MPQPTRSVPADLYPTTRRYPRTTAEAFRGPDYACAVERPEAASPRRLLSDLSTAVGMVAVCAIPFWAGSLARWIGGAQ